MQFIVDFLSSISNTIQSVFFFVVHLIEGIVNFFLSLPSYISYLTTAIGALPGFLTAFATIVISVGIIRVLMEVK